MRRAMQPAGSREETGPAPVILDTDIGVNIDDALALLYLLKQPQCDLLGVTTVGDEPGRRALLARAICAELGRQDIPIAPGCGAPWLGKSQRADLPQAAALPAGAEPQSAPEHAVLLMQRLIRAHPGKVRLIAVGPLTNLATLFALDPETASLIGELTIMGGQYQSGCSRGCLAETNLIWDPYAAARVLDTASGAYLFGLDVTLEYALPAGECLSRLRQIGSGALLGMFEVWAAGGPREVVFHDPLAAAWPFCRAVSGMAPADVAVELTGRYTRGVTVRSSSADGRHFVAVEANPSAFFQHYWSTIGSAGR